MLNTKTYVNVLGFIILIIPLMIASCAVRQGVQAPAIRLKRPPTVNQLLLKVQNQTLKKDDLTLQPWEVLELLEYSEECEAVSAD